MGKWSDATGRWRLRIGIEKGHLFIEVPFNALG